MMAGYLLDSGVLIRHLRGQRKTVRLVRGLAPMGRLHISVITRVEIRAGMLPEERYRTQKLLSRLQSLPVDDAVADRAGDFVHLLRERGQTVDIADVLIAATAFHHQLTLVTFNPKHFPLPGFSLYPPPE